MEDELAQLDASASDDMQSEIVDDAESIASKKKSDENGIIAVLIG